MFCYAEFFRTTALPDRYRLIVEAAPHGVLLVDARGHISLLNEQAETMFGYNTGELLGQPIEILLPDQARAGHTSLRNAYLDDPVSRTMGAGRDLLGQRKDKSRFPVEIGLSVLDDGFDTFIMASVIDISERVGIAQALRAADERFRQLAENIDEVFWLTDVNTGERLYISPAYERIWGRSCESLYSAPADWLRSVHPDDLARVIDALPKQISGDYDIEYRIVRPDGETRWVRDHAFPVHAPDGTVVRIAGVAEDITKRRHLEMQLQQSQRMESVGQLAGGVAHDFNNLLTVINGSVELIRSEPPGSRRTLELADDIQRAAERAAGLTAQLLAFSRQEVLEPRLTNLNAVVSDTQKMLTRLIGEDIDLAVSLDPQAPAVLIDPGRWSQVLINLAVNARDAMSEGGQLSIETREVEIDDTYVSEHLGARRGRYVRLAVSDTGTGMTPDVRSRIFDPFFTTKGHERGTGLGLSVVLGIVQQSGGRIDVYSEPGVGTTFRILVPVAAPSSPLPLPKPPRREPAGSGTILLVEDEPAVRRIAAEFLTRGGYSVITATDGAHALKIIAALTAPVSLLLTDVVMPGADGRRVADAIRARFPETPVVYMSGYTDDAVVRHGILQAEVAFIAKPYSSQSLLAKVRETIGGQRSGI